MNMNVKSIFLVLAILTLLVSVAGVCAADDIDYTDESISTLQDTSSDVILKQTTSPSDNDNQDTKNIEKSIKQLKEDSITIDDIEYTNSIENEEIDEIYIEESTFINNVQISDSLESEAPLYINNSIINTYFGIYGNENTIFIHNSTLNCELYTEKDTILIIDEYTTLNDDFYLDNWDVNIYTNNSEIINYFKDSGVYIGNSIIENEEINDYITNNGNLTVRNSTLNGEINNEGTLRIEDDVIFGDEFIYGGNGEIIINDISRLAPYMNEYNNNYAFNNVIINRNKFNHANISFTNSTLNSTIYNMGSITISDDTIFGENFAIVGDGKIIINDTDKIFPYLSTYDGDYMLDNITFSGNSKTNNGNMTLVNSVIDLGYWTNSWGWEYYTVGTLVNNGNLTLINCTLNCSITNTGNCIIDECLIPSSGIGNQGNLTISNVEWDGITGMSLQYNIESNTKIINSSFSNNSGIFFAGTYGANIEIYNSTFNNVTTIAQNANIIIDKCNFTNCTTGNNFIRGYNVSVSNSIFDNNKINNRFSLITITNDLGNIINNTFSNNYMNATDSWNYYSGIAVYAFKSSGYENTINISNNTFENNYINAIEGQVLDYEWHDYHSNGYGTDIRIDSTDNLIISNNTFKNSTTTQKAGSLYCNNIKNVEIYDNIFKDVKAISETIIHNNSVSVTIYNNTYINSTIDFDNLSIENPGKVFAGDNITLKANIALCHPEYYDENLLNQTQYNWYINGENIITNSTEYNITVPEDMMIIHITPTITNTRSNLLVLTPTVVGDKIITPENINKNLFEGELIGISSNTRLIFQGDFINIGEIYSKTNATVFDGTNATFVNTSFAIEANDNTIQNMNINNTDTSNYIITTEGNNNLIRNNILTQYNSDGLTAAIKDFNSQNTIITNNKIDVTGPARDITYGEGASIANTQAILSINTENSRIDYNNITVTNSTDSELAPFGTIEAITAPQGINNTIEYNNIQVTGSRFVYGINALDNVNDNRIRYNNITVTGYRYTDGIQVGNGAQNNIIANNNINLTCLNDTEVDEAAISYGIIVTSQGGAISNNNTLQENNITINGAVNYGMEIYTATNTNINNNNITLTGVKSMGIGYAHSPNSTVNKNTIIINDDTTQPLNGVTEEIQPLSVGIRIQQDSENITIENNTIKTNDVAKTDKTINTEDINTIARYNKLTSSTGYGQDTIITIPDNVLIRDNKLPTITTMEIPNVILANKPVEITAYVTDEDNNPITGGYVTFRKGWDNIANVTVTNGIATSKFTFTELETFTLITTYWPTSTEVITSSDEKTITIEDARTIISIDEVSATAGQNVTLTARITDQLGNNFNGGKVTFKVNGKTVKDANGKVVYAKVVDGVATATYEVPMDASGKDLNITAVYSGSTKYDKQTTTTTVTVIEATPTLTITPFNEPVTTGSTVTLKAKVALGDTPITTGKIVFKINGKTVKDANGKVIYAKVDVNGEVSVDYNIGDLKANTYTVEAVFTASGYDKLTSNTTMTVVKA